MAAVSRELGVPVKWIEDRAEHLTAASASGDRIGTIAAAFKQRRRADRVAFPQRRQHGRLSAAARAGLGLSHALRLQRLLCGEEHRGRQRRWWSPTRRRSASTAATAGRSSTFALERMMEIAARELGIDPAELRRRNFVPKEAFPYSGPAGSILDAGDYAAALDELLRLADYDELLRRREEARTRRAPVRHRLLRRRRAVRLQHGLCGARADRRKSAAKTDPKSGAQCERGGLDRSVRQRDGAPVAARRTGRGMRRSRRRSSPTSSA